MFWPAILGPKNRAVFNIVPEHDLSNKVVALDLAIMLGLSHVHGAINAVVESGVWNFK